MPPQRSRRSRPERTTWTKEQLVHRRAVLLGNALDKSTLSSYSSALNSYLNFCHRHELPVDPTPDTLSLYAAYETYYLTPKSVDNYLSGISQQLEAQFPDIRMARSSPLVRRTLRGSFKMDSDLTRRKRALTVDDLQLIMNHYQTSQHHDDLLFVAMLLTGFFGLMRLGELTFPDSEALVNWRKVTRRASVNLSQDRYEFTLPYHKADHLFEGNKVIIKSFHPSIDPVPIFQRYLTSRDNRMALASPLWLTASGNVPTRSFFIKRLRIFFDTDVAGQSMRAGGATLLAECGTAPQIIQGIGRWSSEAFKIYVRKNPVILQGMLYSRRFLPT